MAKLPILAKRWDVLDANDESCRFRINIDVLNEAFGVGRSMYPKACYPDKKDVTFSGNKPGDRFIIWMPKLYSNSSEWKNSLYMGGVEIHEDAESTRHEDWMDFNKHDLTVLRLVFVKPDPKSPYKFVGVYRSGKMRYLHHTYERISTKVRLIGNPVYRIELLNDNRS
ncbi:MAG: hypothetical protein K6G34_16050 [Lachnospiraceae bacterium]|nr:hypothetical protein [Lachnospiraceae bacterium]